MRSAIAYSPFAILFGASAKKKAVFFRQLATLVNSGLPVGRALSSASDGGLGQIGVEMTKLIEGKGYTLSKAMGTFPHHFERHEVALVQAGESAGQLDRQLEELAKESEDNWRLKKQVQSKLLYPVVIAHCAVLLPPLFLLVKDGIGAYVRAVSLLLVPSYILIGLLFFTYRFFRLQGGPRRVLDHFLTSLPIISTALKLGARMRFLRVLSNLIEAGFIPGQAVPLAAESCNNFWLRDAVIRSFKALGREAPISEVMQRSQSFQAFENGLVVSGEEAGSLADSLRRASESIRPDYEAHVHRLSVMLPVLLLLLLGGVVAMIAINAFSNIFAPIMSI